MSAVGKIKASRHALQRNDTAIKLYIKVVCVIYFVIIYTFILVRELQSGSNVFTVTDMPSVKICISASDTVHTMHNNHTAKDWAGKMQRFHQLSAFKCTYACHTFSLGNIQQSEPLTAFKAIRKP